MTEKNKMNFSGVEEKKLLPIFKWNCTLNFWLNWCGCSGVRIILIESIARTLTCRNNVWKKIVQLNWNYVFDLTNEQNRTENKSKKTGPNLAMTSLHVWICFVLFRFVWLAMWLSFLFVRHKLEFAVIVSLLCSLQSVTLYNIIACLFNAVLNSD